jgi:citrate synthase
LILTLIAVNVDSIDTAPRKDLSVTAASRSWIPSAGAADRLGVKKQTLYAYVSHGHLASHRRPGLPGTWFDLTEVEDLARRNPPRNARSKRTFAFKGVSTNVSGIEDGELLYRGEHAVELAHIHTFDAVAHWLLPGEFTYRPCILPAAPSGRRQLSHRPRLRSCPRGFPGPTPARRFHRRSHRPSTGALDRPRIGELDSCGAVAASTRADPYAVVLSGLASLSGPLHGAASAHLHTLLARVLDGADVEWALAQYLEQSDGVFVGFTSPQYPDGDPRAADLLAGLRAVPEASDTLSALDAARDVLGERSRPNIDTALAVLCHAGQLRPDAGMALFALARAAGWLAHAAEEYQEHPLRWRGN